MKDPAVLFYTSDFLTGVSFMSMSQRGQYITLLCLQHQKGHLAEKEIKKICHKDSVVLDKFKKDENGMYYNERMEKEIEKRESHCQKQRENIMKRWNNRGNTTVLPLENENENINKDIDFKKRNKGGAGGKKGTADFDSFWKSYPRKAAKQAAQKAWMKLKPDNALLAIMLTAIEAQKKSKDWTKDEGQFIPYPATWLNQRRWEDEVTPTSPQKVGDETAFSCKICNDTGWYMKRVNGKIQSVPCECKRREKA